MRLPKILFLFSLFVYLGSTNAQEKVIPNNPNYNFQSDKATTQTVVNHNTNKSYQRSWKFGGNIGLSFVNGGTDILIAPKAYYQVSPQFITGFGLNYNYSSYNSRTYDYVYNSIGASILGIFRPIPFLQISTEFQESYTDRSYNNIKDNYWVPSLYLGVSFVSGNFSFGMQYDVLYDQYKSPYYSAWTPVISFYF